MEEAAEARVTWMLRESAEQREVQGGNGVGPVMEDGGEPRPLLTHLSHPPGALAQLSTHFYLCSFGR